KRASRETLAQWNAYAWPGNVRELRNIVHRAYVMAHGSQIVDPCLPTQMDPEPAPAAAASTTPTLWVQVAMRWHEIARQVTLAALEYFDGHHQHTCDALGISVKTLYNWLRDWSLISGRRQRLRSYAEQART